MPVEALSETELFTVVIAAPWLMFFDVEVMPMTEAPLPLTTPLPLVVTVPSAVSVMAPEVAVTTFSTSIFLSLPPAVSVIAPVPAVTTPTRPAAGAATVMFPAVVASLMADDWAAASCRRRSMRMSPPTRSTPSWAAMPMSMSPLPVFSTSRLFTWAQGSTTPVAALATRWAARIASVAWLSRLGLATSCRILPAVADSVMLAGVLEAVLASKVLRILMPPLPLASNFTSPWTRSTYSGLLMSSTVMLPP